MFTHLLTKKDFTELIKNENKFALIFDICNKLKHDLNVYENEHREVVICYREKEVPYKWNKLHYYILKFLHLSERNLKPSELEILRLAGNKYSTLFDAEFIKNHIYLFFFDLEGEKKVVEVEDEEESEVDEEEESEVDEEVFECDDLDNEDLANIIG